MAFRICHGLLTDGTPKRAALFNGDPFIGGRFSEEPGFHVCACPLAAKRKSVSLGRECRSAHCKK